MWCPQIRSGAVSGGFAGRVACRSVLSSPPSFSGSCFQFSLLPRPGGRSGLALGGLGPRLSPLSFVFVLAALLAACRSAWSLEAAFVWSLYMCFNNLEWEADFDDYKLVFSGRASEADPEDYMLVISGRAFEADPEDCESMISGRETDSVCYVLVKSSLVFADGDRNEILGSGNTKDCLKESPPKFIPFCEEKTATFEFQAHHLFDLCNLAVLVALQVQVLGVGVRAHQLSGEVDDERKKEEEKEGKIEEEIEEEEEE